uniref:Uncharacterized protein n=1 Tax=Romanomermis culicivorax TaxID=13658 RepID=A0A915J971_ROMCU
MVRQKTNCIDLDHDDSLCRQGFVRKIPPTVQELAHAVFDRYEKSKPVFHPRWGTIRKEFRDFIIFAEKSIE